MGVPYEWFLWIYAGAHCLFGITSQADRRSKSLYGLVISREPVGRALLVGAMAGQLAWFALMLIGFLSLKWYLALALFFFPGVVGGVGYALLMVRRGFDAGALHNWLAGISGSLVALLTVVLWANRLLH